MNRITALETDSISGQNKPFAVKTDVDGFEFCEGIESRLRELAALSSTLIESDTEQMSADDHAAVWALVGNIADQSLMLLHGLSERLREIE